MNVKDYYFLILTLSKIGNSQDNISSILDCIALFIVNGCGGK